MHSLLCYVMAVATTCITSTVLVLTAIKYPDPASAPLGNWFTIGLTTLGAALWFKNALDSRR